MGQFDLAPGLSLWPNPDWGNTGIWRMGEQIDTVCVCNHVFVSQIKKQNDNDK